MSLGVPVAIETITVFGYVFDDDGVTPILGAEISFKSDSFQINDNTIKIDEVALSDAAGLYQAVLPKTILAGEIIDVEIRWTDSDGIEHLKEEKIVTGNTDPISVQDARAIANPTKVITGGPQGPPGLQGIQGPQGLPGSAESTFDINSTQNIATPGVYFCDTSGGNIVASLPAAGLATDSTYRFAKITNDANTITIDVQGGGIIGIGSSYVLKEVDSVVSFIDHTIEYHFVVRGDPPATVAPLPLGVAAVGTTMKWAKEDHVHGHGNQAGGTLHSNVVPAGASGFMTGADKTKLDAVASGATNTPLADAAPPEITDAVNTLGVTTEAAREDHTHAHGNRGGDGLHSIATPGLAGFLSAADKTKLNGVATGATADSAADAAPPEITDATNTLGVSPDYALEDHTHSHGNRGGGALHAAATTGVNGFMSAADKTKLDGLSPSGSTKEVFLPAANRTNTNSEYPTKQVAATGTGYFSFFFPNDFTAITDLVLVCIVNAGADGGGKNIDFFSNYAGVTEAKNANSESRTSGVTNLTGTLDVITELDISDIFTSPAANDYAGVRVQHNTIGGTIGYLGIRLKYT